MEPLLLLFLASLWAGAQNALAGGGSFITLPALMLTGMDARAANITSTVALFPAQIVTGYTGRAGAEGAGRCTPLARVPVRIVFKGGSPSRPPCAWPQSARTLGVSARLRSSPPWRRS